MANDIVDIAFTDVVDNNLIAVNETGFFPELMKSINAYTHDEFATGRISGPDYATVYLGAMQYALQEASKFALQLPVQNQQAELLEAQERLIESQIALTDEKLNTEVLQQGLLSAQIVTQTSQAALNDSQKLLTDAKTASELLQADVIVSQAALYESQALAFKYRHKKDLAKLAIDAWTIQSSGSDVYTAPATTEMFGVSVADKLTDADWV